MRRHRALAVSDRWRLALGRGLYGALCLTLLGVPLACTDSSGGLSGSAGSWALLAAGDATSHSSVAAAVRDVLAQPPDAENHYASAADRAQLAALYRARDDGPLWLDRSAHPSGDAREALALLTGAAVEGLDPTDYRAGVLETLATRVSENLASTADLAELDVGLSLGTIRYLRHLHTGRVVPRAVGFQMASHADEHDFGALVGKAVAEHRVRAVADEMTPRLALYRDLRRELANYRRLAAQAALVPPPHAATSLHPGEAYSGLADLRRLLVAVGDLPTDTPGLAAAVGYDGPLVEGVKRFQVRHGLIADGVLGPRTLAALRVPMTQRARQFELALERLRWLPHLDEGPLVVVDIPMFRMWAWESVSAVRDAASLDMRVIVGRARKTQTPVFIEDMRAVIFRPYWNVPASIVRGELLPLIRGDPSYLEHHDMEIVSGQSDTARPVPPTPDNLARLSHGELRLRQRPGPRNSLGLVKFEFPNRDNVYMHDTPATELFAKSRRDFSHGCIRLQDPVALAEWALRHEPGGWTRDRILAAMEGPETRAVPLSRPLQVVLFYMTVVVMPGGDRVMFAEDIYRNDAALDRVLAGRSPAS